MKTVIFVLMLILVGLSKNSIAAQIETEIDSLIASLETDEKEYVISRNDQGLFQSINRNNNISFTYSSNGFIAQNASQKVFVFQSSDTNIISPEEMFKTSSEWKISLTVKSLNNESVSFTGGNMQAEGNKCSITSDKLRVNYQNTKEGMRQDFIIPEKISTSDKLTLELEIETDLKYAINSEAIIFTNTSGEVTMKYSSLKVFDANGTILNASFKKVSDYSFIISVDDAGAVYPITIDPISTSPTWTSAGNQTSSGFGFSVASAGDVNGDGYGDVIVGAPFYDNGQIDEGRAFVFHGSASGLLSAVKWTAESNQNDAHFGWSVSSAGDVNGDGYGDVIVGADQFQGTTGFVGRIYIYYGSANGLVATPSKIMDGNQPNARFGYSVASAGDVNNDGFSDVVIGAPLYDNGQIDEGKIFVCYGSNNGPSIVNMTGESNIANAFFGCVASTAGDVNNDGYDDIIVGAMTYKDSPNYISQGKAFVYHGSSTGLSTIPSWKMENQYTWFTYIGISVASAGDVNNDGYDDVIVGATGFDNFEQGSFNDEGKCYVYYGSLTGLSPTVSWTAEGFQSFARFGNSVASAGDINNDGYDDVIIGSYMSDYGQTDEGSAALYFGATSGLTFPAYKVFESNQAQATYGNSVASAGDVNNDGYDDLIIGAYLYNNGSTTGKTFVYHGASGGPKVLTMKNFIQGLYNPSLNNTKTDSIYVFLRTASPPFAIVDSAKAYINANGVGVYTFVNNVVNNVNYYIEVKHRNSISIWSKTPQSFTNNLKTYNFNTAAIQAYGNNMISVDDSPVAYAMFSGDVNQDQTIELEDELIVHNHTICFSNESKTDLNGDSITDISDVLIVYNNSIKFVAVMSPK